MVSKQNQPKEVLNYKGSVDHEKEGKFTGKLQLFTVLKGNYVITQTN